MTMIRMAAALCFLAVGLGAFGAHWLKPTLEARNLVDVWNKAVLYHFIHAIALFVLALVGSTNRGAWWLLFAGIIIFSGSLYTMGLTGVRWLGAITPIGGLCFLAGWLWRGDFLGDMAMLDGHGRSANATAIEDARLAKLTRDDFLTFMQSDSRVTLELLTALTQRLRRTDELLRHRVSRNVNQEQEARLTMADRAADKLAEFGGSWKFIT